MTKVADIMRIIDKIAPRRLAEDWDNVGLQYGNPNWPVSRVFVSLDPTFNALQSAAAAGANLLVTHHPLIFKPLKSIDVTTPVGSIIDFAAKNRIAIFCAHTNLDSVRGGLNDVLAGKIGLEVSGPLSSVPEAQQYKLVVFASPADGDRIMEELSSDALGGNSKVYGHRAFYSEGTGQFRKSGQGSPDDHLVRSDEVRIEFLVGHGELGGLIDAIGKCCDRDIPEYDIYPLFRKSTGDGLGRVGRFSRERTLVQLAQDIRDKLSLDGVKIAGNKNLKVRTAAVCSGGGSGMVRDFLASGTDVYISGDLNHHAAIDIAAAGRGLIDIGHFASEQIVVEALCAMVRKELEAALKIVKVIAWSGEQDPFTHVV